MIELVNIIDYLESKKKLNKMKRCILIMFLSFALFGCTENKEELEKNDYLFLKQKLIEKEEFSKNEDINFDLNISVDRVNDEEISYRAIIDNPKENMYNVKALVIHNHLTDEVFPSIGLFDDTVDLIIDNEEVKGVSLVGYIKTIKEIEDLNLDIKVYVEYTNEDNEVVKTYYKTTK